MKHTLKLQSIGILKVENNLWKVICSEGNQFGRHYMWSWNRNVDTDNVFENVFEYVEYFKNVFKYKYLSFLNVKYKYFEKSI